jgi:hypothetical protein
MSRSVAEVREMAESPVFRWLRGRPSIGVWLRSATLPFMKIRTITQRELRNESGAVLREVEAGRTIIAPVLPHVILLLDASPAMLPAGLGLTGFESFMNRKTKPSLTPKAAEARITPRIQALSIRTCARPSPRCAAPPKTVLTNPAVAPARHPAQLHQPDATQSRARARPESGVYVSYPSKSAAALAAFVDSAIRPNRRGLGH